MSLRVTSGMVPMRLLEFKRESDLHIARIRSSVAMGAFEAIREATHRLRDLTRPCTVAMLGMTDVL